MIPRAFLPLLLLVLTTVVATNSHQGLIRNRQWSDASEENRHAIRGLALKYSNTNMMIHRNLQRHQASTTATMEGRNLKRHHQNHPTEAEIKVESKKQMEEEAAESAKEEEIKEDAIIMAEGDDDDAADDDDDDEAADDDGDDDDDDDEATDDDDDDDEATDDDDDDDDDEATDDDDDDEAAADDDDDDDDDDEEEEEAIPAVVATEAIATEPETEQVVVSKAAVEDESPIAAILDGTDPNENYWIAAVVGFGLVVLLVGMTRKRGQKRSRPANVETLNLHQNLRDPEIEMIQTSGTGLSNRVLGGPRRNSTPSFGNNLEDEPIWSIRHSMTSVTGTEVKAAMKTVRPSKKNSPPASAFKQHASKF